MDITRVYQFIKSIFKLYRNILFHNEYVMGISNKLRIKHKAYLYL